MSAVLNPRAPGRFHIIVSVIVTIAYGALAFSVIPWVDTPGPDNSHIVVAYASAILLADLCTALLLGDQYRATGRTALLILMGAYLFSALMALLHITEFRGALLAQPLFGSEQTVGWLYVTWRLVCAALYVAAILCAARAEAPLSQAEIDRRLGWGIGAALGACVLAVLVAVGVKAAGMAQGHFTAVNQALQWAAVAFCVAGLVVVSARRAFDDVLYVWLGLVLVGWIADLTLSNLGGARYTTGWHAARATFVLSTCLLLALLLGEIAKERMRSAVVIVATYGGALALMLAAIYLRWLFVPWLADTVPYITLFGVAAISVWFGGWAPAALASAVGYVLVNILFIEPTGRLSVDKPADVLGFLLFSFSCALIIVLGEGMRRARFRYQASEEALRERAMQLQRADANKSQFLAILSHELRNPLAPLRTGVAILKLKKDAPGPPGLYDMMDRQITQLARLIDDLLDVSRIDRGKLALQSEPLALDSVVRSAIETSAPNIAAKSHELVVRYAQQPLHVEGDAVRLAQVLSNLLNNAAKYTPNNGRIELSMRAEGGQAVVSIADNGIGIAPEHLANVFDMFVQLDSSKVAGAGGLGLGLTLARSIVQQHGGTLEARSAGAGKGAEFVMRLPLVAAPAAAAEQAAQRRGPSATGRRILVVDDNEDAARSLAQLLRLEDYQVEVALDGTAALRIAEALRPDVAFIDLNMPGMDGVELARRLRASPWGRAAKLIALTGMGQESDIVRTREAGFDDHLTKPADPDRLARLAAGTQGEVLPFGKERSTS